MRALITTLHFDELDPQTDARIAEIAGAFAAVDGLLSTNWLRSGGRFALVQTFASHCALDGYLDGHLFAVLGRLPGCRDVYTVQYDVSTQLNALSVLGRPEDALPTPTPDLVPA